MTFWAKFGVIIFCLIAVGFFGWYIRGWADDAALKAQADADLTKLSALQKQAEADAANYERGKAANNAKITKLTQQIGAFRAKDKIPADCFIPSDGMLAISNAVKGSGTK